MEQYLNSFTALFDSRLSVKEASGQRKSIKDMLDLWGATENELINAEKREFAYRTGIDKDVPGRSSKEIQIEIGKEYMDTDYYQDMLKQREELEQRQKAYDDVTAEIKQVQADIKATKDKAEKQELQARLKELKAEQKQLKLSSADKKNLDRLNKQIESYANSSYDSELYKSLEAQELELLNRQKEYDELQKTIAEKNAEITNKKKEIAATTDKTEKARLQGELKTLQDELKGIKNDPTNKKKKKLSAKELKNLAAIQEQMAAMRNISEQAIVDESLAATANYQELVAKIADLQAKKAAKKNIDETKLAMYLDELAAINKGVLASSIDSYIKIYEEWWKLNQIKDTTASVAQLKRFDVLDKQKKAIEEAYVLHKQSLQQELEDALLREGETELTEEQRKQNLTRSQQDMENLYAERIRQAQESYKDTATFKDIEAKYKKLVNEKNTLEAKGKKLSAAKQKQLANYEAQMAALINGGTADNIADYLKAFDYVQKNKDKYEKGTLKGKAADQYDKYVAMINKWDKEKQQEISDLQRERADALKQLLEEFEKQSNENEQAVEDQKKKLWELAKEMAEFQIESAKTSVAMFEAIIAQYEKAVELLDSASIETLKNFNVLDLFGLDDTKSTSELLSQKLTAAINAASNKVDAQVSLAHMYEDLLDASEKGNGFEGIFQNYIDQYTEMLENATTDKERETAQGYLDRINTLISKLNENDYSDNEWITEWNQGLSDILNEIATSIGEVQNFKDQLREKVVFRAAIDAINDLETLNSRLSSMAGIINDDWVQDENGLTEYGRAKIMLLANEAQNAQDIVRNAAQHIQDVQDAQLNENTKYATEADYQKALSDAWQEYSSALQDVYSIDNQIYELSKKQQEAELKRLDKLISKRKEALANKKAYYDYDKNIRNQTKNIEALKSEIAALQDVNDAYSKSRLKQLNTQLAEAEEELQHTKDEHLYDMQINALDKMLDDYSNSLEESAKTIKDTFEQWAEQIRQAVADSSGVDVNGALQEIADFLMGGYVSVPTAQTATVSSDIANNNLVPIDSNLGGSSSLATPLSGILVDTAAIEKITSSIEKSGIDITSINTRQDEYTKQMLTLIRSINDRLDVNLSSVSDAINNKQLIANITINGQTANVTYNGVRTASGTAPSYH